ncbi:unnamed protein product [Brachionus calyciflorus]|nr:unnamed protein product [Brachionus calyciflorus]
MENNRFNLKNFEKSDKISDVTDGRIYQQLLESDDAYLFRNNRAFSFCLNTDGISLCNKSKITIWPVYLNINEIPIQSRYSLENTILAGMCVGDEKPNFDSFLHPIILQLSKLEMGINLKVNNLNTLCRFFLLYGIFDKPARSSILNMIAHNGDYGCLKCLQKGNTIDYRHLYNFNDIDFKGPKRTDEHYNLTICSLGNGENYGVKGACSLSNLKYYKPVSSTCIDYMHSLLEGVVKNLFKYWFDPSEAKNKYSLRRYMQEVDNRLLTIKPPSFVPKTPRTIYSYNLWRAHEYLAFIIYYALPIFKDIMKFEYYQNLKKLVIFVEVLLSKNINKKDLILVEAVIREFVKEVQDLYSKKAMLSGMHELLHLVDCTFDFDNLHCFNENMPISSAQHANANQMTSYSCIYPNPNEGFFQPNQFYNPNGYYLNGYNNMYYGSKNFTAFPYSSKSSFMVDVEKSNKTFSSSERDTESENSMDDMY